MKVIILDDDQRTTNELIVVDRSSKPVNQVQLFNLYKELSQKVLNENGRAQASKEPHHRVNESAEATGAASQLSDNMMKIKAYIDRHYVQDISLDELADHVHLHPNYISALFKKEMGIRFIQYVRAKRINKAIELLGQHPNRSIVKISEESGFENVRHFFTVFKRYCGMTPGEYREKLQRNRSYTVFEKSII